MPTPHQDESREDFIKRCIPIVLDEGTAEGNDQAYAMCNSMFDDKRGASSTAYRFMALPATVADIRVASHEGSEHYVVPVVAMVGDSAIRAMGSQGYELVPSSELEAAPFTWNGRPVMLNHPVLADGSLVSANEPDVFDRFGIGRIYHTRFEEGRLKMEAWINVARASALNDDSRAVLDKIAAREMVEVSVGCRISIEPTSGVDARGQSYTGIWRDIVPDHLAMLSVGAVGACSNDLGCGAPRAATQPTTTRSAEVRPMSLIQRLLSKLRLGNEESGPSDNDLRYKLYEALRASEPAFDNVIEVYAESGTVIYCVSPDGVFQLKRRSYKMDGDELSLGDDVEEVEARVNYVPVATKAAAAAQPDTTTPESTVAVAPSTATVDTPAAASCGCGDHRIAAVNVSKGDSNMATNKELAARLIACKGSPFGEEDRANLEAMCPTRLAKLADQLDPPTPPAPEPEPVTRTAEQWFAEAPEEVRAMVSRYQTEEKARHAALVSTLKGAQKVYSEERLAAMTVPQLEEVAALVNVAPPAAPVSFIGQGLPDPRGAAATAEPTAPPRPYDIALAARRGAGDAKSDATN